MLIQIIVHEIKTKLMKLQYISHIIHISINYWTQQKPAVWPCSMLSKEMCEAIYHNYTGVKYLIIWDNLFVYLARFQKPVTTASVIHVSATVRSYSHAVTISIPSNHKISSEVRGIDVKV